MQCVGACVYMCVCVCVFVVLTCVYPGGVGAMLRQHEAAATQAHWQILQLAHTPDPGL